MKSKKPSHNKTSYDKPNNEKIIWLSPLLLQTQVLRVGQVNEPCIGLIQENSIDYSVQDCLSYIPKPHGLC